MRTHSEATLKLDGGNWRYDPFRRVQVWVPDGPVETECAFDDLPPPEVEPAPPPRTLGPIQHGTDAGYQQHVRRKVFVCEPCSDAHRIAQRKYADARAARKRAA